MKKIIANLVLQVSLLILLLGLLYKSLPYYWANNTYSEKYEYFQTNKDKYNVLFFGSSSTHVQVMPTVFDKNTTQSTNSFNLAPPATFNPENYFLLEKLLSQKAKEETVILIDIINIGDIHKTNLHTIRAKYYLGIKEFLFFFKDFFDKDKVYIKNKIYVLKNYFITLFEHTFKINFRKDIIKYCIGEIDTGCPLGKYKDGNCSYEYEISLLDEKSSKRRGLELRKVNFINGGQLRLKDIDKKIERYSSQNAKVKAAKDYQSFILKLEELQSMAIQNNYEPIFYILPPGGYHKISILKNLEKSQTINLIQPDLYPELFIGENHFDEGHLNEKSSVILSEALASEFNELVTNRDQ